MGERPMSNRSKQIQKSNRGARSQRARTRPLLATAAVIGGTSVMLSAPVAALFIGTGTAQAAPPADLCTSLIGCNDLATSVIGGSALPLLAPGTDLSDPPSDSPESHGG